jgi:DNA-binding transcriptional MerR regulator
MECKFKIGEIAGIFDVSNRALRLYDKMDVLKPGFIDGKTGYRYYTAEQVHEMQTLISLKSVGFSLMEIKAVLDDQDHPAKLLELLSQKKESWLDRIEIAKFNIKLISEMEKNAMEETEKKKGRTPDPELRAHRLSRLVSMENSKIDTVLSEVLWL